MALYYFDVDDNGELYSDDQGVECRDFAEVRYEAIRALAEMTREALPGGDHHKVVIVVRDSGCDLVFRASIVFEVEAERFPAGSSPDSHA
ncbi:DUF6894 family protein [Mesorhizobium sp. 128a]